jgi:hypothetical protein
VESVDKYYKKAVESINKDIIKAKVKVKDYVEKKLANVDKIKNKVVNYFLETLFNYK